MIPRERAIRTIHFKKPDRFPVFHQVTPAALIKHGEKLTQLIQHYPSEFTSCGVYTTEQKEVNLKKGERRKRFIDEWGCVWEEKIEGIEGQVIAPVLADWSKLPSCKVPDGPLRETRIFNLEKEKIKKERQQLYFVAGYDRRYGNYVDGFTFFQRLNWLRGMENLMIDIAENRQELSILADKLSDYIIRGVKKCLQLGVDGVMFADDWGTQKAFMINPEFWRNFFKPYYREMFQVVHDAGADVIFHSDGYTMDIIPDLIELGVDVFNPQFSCMDLNKLADVTRGKVCIMTGIDRQNVLPFGSPIQVEEYVKEMVEKLAHPEGGLILAAEIGPDVPFENIEAMYFAFDKYGK